ncbi:LLM class flavin-dependent oxidoreductase [Frondihabitans cladoniiphilus]
MSSSARFGILLDLDGAGAHPAAWRVSRAEPAELLSARWIADATRDAERAGFTGVTFEDHPLPVETPTAVTARIDATLRASFTAPLTSAIGLVPVVQALYNEPFHVATQLASLDTASDGRAGAILGRDGDARIAARYGRTPLAPDQTAEELADVVEAIRRVWDTWEDDAVIRDARTGRYFDRAKVHYADFEGHRFSIKGPAILPRSPQGQLPLFAIDSSDGGGVAAPDADVLLVELEVALDRAGRTGAERVAELDAHIPWASTGRRRYVGDAAGLLALLTELAATTQGVRILPAVLDADLDEIGRAVLPELRRAGVFESPQVGATLRETLGLAPAENRYATAASTPAASTPAAQTTTTAPTQEATR